MKNLGEEFIWFFGVVEDRADPLQLGRVRVRCYGWHTADKREIPTADLPWAQPMQPITSAAMGDIGRSPTGLVEGTWVIGFFADGMEAQRPIIMGSIAGIPTEVADPTKGFNDPNGVYPSRIEEPDVDQRARGTNNISKSPDSTIGEPADPYAAEYPKNHTFRSESGHLIEVDDTPGAERIHIYHKSGTFIEMHPNGDVVTQHKNGWRSVTGNDKIHITGDMSIVVDGNVSWTVGGNMTETVTGNVSKDYQTNYHRTVTGESHIRFDGDKHEHIGADSYSRHDGGTDYSCPDDPPRTSGQNCDDVELA